MVGLQRKIAEGATRVLEGVNFGIVASKVVAESGFWVKLAEGRDGKKLRCPISP